MCGWKYTGEYSVYNCAPWGELKASGAGITHEKTRASEFYSVYDKDSYVGFFRLSDNGDMLNLGLGLAPEHCGNGMGKPLMELIKKYVADNFPSQILRVYVRAFNTRAIKCYKKAGVVTVPNDENTPSHADFITMVAVDYRRVGIDEIEPWLWRDFNRHQVVTRCLRKQGSVWNLADIPFTEEWGSSEIEQLCGHLKSTIESGGVLIAAFVKGKLKGFTSVENKPFGEHNEYLQLSSLHTSFEMRGTGIGKKLFSMACEYSREKHAEKLYISAHSAEETQAFYRAVGCVHAVYINEKLADAEPYDVQMECALS